MSKHLNSRKGQVLMETIVWTTRRLSKPLRVRVRVQARQLAR